MRLKTKCIAVGSKMLIVDHREKKLSAAMEGITQFEIQSLPLGDVICKYDDGSSWVCERKTSQDFATSIKNGRWGWADQNEKQIETTTRKINVLTVESHPLLAKCFGTVKCQPTV